MTKDDVVAKLKECYDPEIPHVNVVDLGLIYDVRVDGKKVEVDMTLTARGCPMAQYMAVDAKRKIEELPGAEDVAVNIVWDPPWTPDRITEAGRKALGW